jgi:uncharacterized membrane protein
MMLIRRRPMLKVMSLPPSRPTSVGAIKLHWRSSWLASVNPFCWWVLQLLMMLSVVYLIMTVGTQQVVRRWATNCEQSSFMATPLLKNLFFFLVIAFYVLPLFQFYSILSRRSSDWFRNGNCAWKWSMNFWRRW